MPPRKRKPALPPLTYVVAAHPLLLVSRIYPNGSVEYSARAAAPEGEAGPEYPLSPEDFDRLTAVAHVDVTDTLARVIHIVGGGRDDAEGEEIFSAPKSSPTPAQEN